MIKRIDVKWLQVGMYVTQLDRPWIETPFLLKKFLIKSPQQVSQLKEYCSYVDIDTDKGKDADAGIPAADLDARTVSKLQAIEKEEGPPEGSSQVPFEDEIQQALVTRDKTKEVVDHMLEDVRIGRSIDTAEAKQVVENIMESITRNREALVCLTQLKNRDEYTSIHSMNVCILCIAFGRHLGLRREQLQLLGVGALLHDIGKMRVPLEILNKPGRLTEDEFAIMKNHVTYAAGILEKTAGFSPRSMKVVMEHHERFTGGGYPLGLNGENISALGQLAGIVDVYDAITSDRVYHNHMHPHEAIKKMYEWSARDFNKGLLEKFIKCVGIYPLGSLVEINHADLGIVVSSHEASALKPAVMLVLDERGQAHEQPRIIDLMQKDKSGEKHKWTITKVMDPEQCGVEIERFVRGKIVKA
jgi:putative nucleotidyltransferase with HDIG domain